MAWKKRKIQEEEDEYTRPSPSDPDFLSEFLEDWEGIRNRHQGQTQVLNAFFKEGAQYIFNRAGRKFSKTTTNIDIVWRFAHENPGSVIYMCFPTITLGVEIVWDEKRLQWCDARDDYMLKKYVQKVDEPKHMLYFTNGSYVKVIGTWTEARGRGTQPDLLVVDEIQDCSGDYLDAMDPNLAAKNGRCVMSGTPPKKRNHYHEWEDRIFNNPKGKIFKFTSYSNDRLEHLSEWLDAKKQELTRAGKEDVWVREYLAEDCFSHAERVLPDARFQDFVSLEEKINQLPYKDKTPVMAIATQGNYLSAIWGILTPKKELYILEYELRSQIWDRSYAKFFEEEYVKEKTKKIQVMCGNRMRQLLWDPTKSFKDVIRGFTDCKQKPEWQDRGIPLLKEMMIENKIIISDKVAPFGLECQNLLMDESRREIEKMYPLISTFSMAVNEYFQREKISVAQTEQWDRFKAFRDAGLPLPTQRKKGNVLFKQR